MISPFAALPNPAEARAHPLAWALRASGIGAIEGEEARLLGVPDGSRLPRYRLARHIRWLGEQLMRVERGEVRRLIVSMPPRHSKSETISRYYTGWHIGRHPDHEVILASYSDRLTRGWSRKVRDDLAGHGQEVFGVTAMSRSSAIEWQPRVAGRRTEGNFFATSVGGTATGKGAHRLVVDDLIKGSAEARSKALRDEAWEFLVQELLTRLAPGGAVIVIGTRWHPDDPIGRLLDAQRRGGDETVNAIPWHYAALPALAEEGDPLGREPGEALWPERFPRSALLAIRDGPGGPRSWASLYQCRPVAAGGDVFQERWLRYWNADGPFAVLPEDCANPRLRLDLRDLTTFLTVDLAASDKQRSDHSVIATWGAHARTGTLLLLDLVRERLPGPEIIPRIRAQADKRGARTIWIEKTIYHTTLIADARRQGLPIRELKPDASKIVRAQPATALLEGGKLLLRAGARWLPELVDELLSFPSGPDDQVDCVSYAAKVFLDQFVRHRGQIMDEDWKAGAGDAPRAGDDPSPGGGWLDQIGWDGPGAGSLGGWA